MVQSRSSSWTELPPYSGARTSKKGLAKFHGWTDRPNSFPSPARAKNCPSGTGCHFSSSTRPRPNSRMAVTIHVAAALPPAGRRGCGCRNPRWVCPGPNASTRATSCGATPNRDRRRPLPTAIAAVVRCGASRPLARFAANSGRRNSPSTQEAPFASTKTEARADAPGDGGE